MTDGGGHGRQRSREPQQASPLVGPSPEGGGRSPPGEREAAVIAWEIPFEIVDRDEAAVARKIEAFHRWCRGKGTEARVAWQRDLGLTADDGSVRRLVAFELRSERFRHPAFYHHWHRLFARPMREPAPARARAP